MEVWEEPEGVGAWLSPAGMVGKARMILVTGAKVEILEPEAAAVTAVAAAEDPPLA